MSVRVRILRAAGTNCDRELVYAFERCGAETELLPLQRVLESKDPFGGAAIVGFPGGFSYGDDVASGKIFAVELTARVADPLRRFIERGGLAIGICNGFQVLVKAGILPGFELGKQAVTLTNNVSGRFEERWVRLEALPCRAAFVPAGDSLEMPSAHGEGRFLADDATMRRVVDERLVAFRYQKPAGAGHAVALPADYPANPNGSEFGIAGICDIHGRVLGLMPHPERHIEAHHHPEWTRHPSRTEGDGLRLFRNLVEQARRGE